MDVQRARVAEDDQVDSRLRALTFRIGLLASVAAWVILATLWLRPS